VNRRPMIAIAASNFRMTHLLSRGS
jgi:hypothetical protein